MIWATVKSFPVTATVAKFAVTCTVVARALLASVAAPLEIRCGVFAPWEIRATVRDVAPPINAGGFLYDRNTGAMLYDAVTGAALFA